MLVFSSPHTHDNLKTHTESARSLSTGKFARSVWSVAVVVVSHRRRRYTRMQARQWALCVKFAPLPALSVCGVSLARSCVCLFVVEIRAGASNTANLGHLVRSTFTWHENRAHVCYFSLQTGYINPV